MMFWGLNLEKNQSTALCRSLILQSCVQCLTILNVDSIETQLGCCPLKRMSISYI